MKVLFNIFSMVRDISPGDNTTHDLLPLFCMCHGFRNAVQPFVDKSVCDLLSLPCTILNPRKDETKFMDDSLDPSTRIPTIVSYAEDPKATGGWIFIPGWNKPYDFGNDD